MNTPLQVILPLRVEPPYLLFLPLAFFLEFEENILPVVELCLFFYGLRGGEVSFGDRLEEGIVFFVGLNVGVGDVELGTGVVPAVEFADPAV